MDVKVERKREAEHETEKKSLREHLDEFLVSGGEKNRCEGKEVVIKKEPEDLWTTTYEYNAASVKVESEGQAGPVKAEPQDLWSSCCSSSVKVEREENVCLPVESEPEGCRNCDSKSKIVKQESVLVHAGEEERITTFQGVIATGSFRASVKLEPVKREDDTLEANASTSVKVEVDSSKLQVALEPVTINHKPNRPESTVKQENSADETPEVGCSENNTAVKPATKTGNGGEVPAGEETERKKKVKNCNLGQTLDHAHLDCSEDVDDPAPVPTRPSCSDPNEAVHSFNTCSAPSEIPRYSSNSSPNIRSERKAKKKAQLNLREDEDDHDFIEPTKKKGRFSDYGGPTRSNGGRKPAVWGYQPDPNELHTYSGFKLKPCFVKMFPISNEILMKHGLEPDVKKETSSVLQVGLHALKNWHHSCIHCDYQSNNLREFRLHGRTHTYGTERIECPECDYLAVTLSSLYVHRMTVHRKGKEVQCTRCDFRTELPFMLREHQKMHIDSPYRCGYCDYTAKTYSSLMNHTNTHTGEKPYACYYCSYRATQLSHLRAHISVHLDLRPFQCPLCDHKTRQKSQLRQHMQFTHSDYRPLKCDFCDHAAKSKQALESHIRCKHTLEEPYSCNQCPFKTAHSSVLKAHTKGHLERYKIRCQHCTWSTDSSRARANHILKSHPEKIINLKCCNCDFRTLDRKLLDSHKSTENH